MDNQEKAKTTTKKKLSTKVPIFGSPAPGLQGVKVYISAELVAYLKKSIPKTTAFDAGDIVIQKIFSKDNVDSAINAAKSADSEIQRVLKECADSLGITLK